MVPRSLLCRRAIPGYYIQTKVSGQRVTLAQVVKQGVAVYLPEIRERPISAVRVKPGSSGMLHFLMNCVQKLWNLANSGDYSSLTALLIREETQWKQPSMGSPLPEGMSTTPSLRTSLHVLFDRLTVQHDSERTETLQTNRL